MKVAYQQRISSEKIVVKAIIKKEVAEEFFIIDIESVTGRKNQGFAVTSNRGTDTYGNGLAFATIEKAIAYIRFTVKNADYYLHPEK